MNTASGYKNRILGYAAENGHDISDGRAMKLAIQLHRRQARMQDEDLERIFMHSDPTPKLAIRNLRATRRNLSTQPFPRDMGPKTPGQRIRYTPLTPDELAWIITEAREQRVNEDIHAYQRSKR